MSSSPGKHIAGSSKDLASVTSPEEGRPEANASSLVATKSTPCNDNGQDETPAPSQDGLADADV